MTDSKVDHPAYYGGKDDPYEAIKVIDAWGLDFCLGNAVKYISRAGKKEPECLLQDLSKAKWYLEHEIESIKHQQKLKNANVIKNVGYNQYKEQEFKNKYLFNYVAIERYPQSDYDIVYVTDVHSEKFGLMFSGYGVSISSGHIANYFNNKTYSEGDMTSASGAMNESQVKSFLDLTISSDDDRYNDRYVLIDWVHVCQHKEDKS